MSPVLVGAAILYVVTSSLLFFYPHILHAKKRETVMVHVRHISHRGGGAERPENTMEAYKHALEAGTEMLELDVRLTQDEHVVVVHDASLDRLYKTEALIKEVDFKDLPKAFKKQSKEVQWRFEDDYDHCMPLLEEVFQAFPGVPINIDLKDHSQVLVDKVLILIKKYNRENLVVWGSFWENTCQLLQQTDPHIPTMCSGRRVIFLTVCYYLGILSFLPIKESFLEIPMYKDVPGLSGKWKILLWIVKNLLGNPRYFAYLNRRGITVFSWVQNSVEEYEFCYHEKKVNGIMTDKPTLLTEFFAKHPKHKWYRD